jgi:hypothetical protein
MRLPRLAAGGKHMAQIFLRDEGGKHGPRQRLCAAVPAHLTPRLCEAVS